MTNSNKHVVFDLSLQIQTAKSGVALLDKNIHFIQVDIERLLLGTVPLPGWAMSSAWGGK